MVCLHHVVACLAVDRLRNTTTEETAQQTGIAVYPRNMEALASGFADIQEAPAIIYTTPAEENGLWQADFYFTGTVEKYVSSEEDENGFSYFLLKTDVGTIAIMDYTNFFYDSEQELLQYVDEDILDDFLAEPQVGEYVRVYGSYTGYSNLLDRPTAAYGTLSYLQNVFDDIL